MMKKWMLVVLSVMVMASAAYAAPDRIGKLDAGVNVSGMIYDDDEVDSTVYVGGTAAYGINEWLAIGVESGWSESDVDSGLGTSDTLTAIPLMGDIILRVPLKDSPVIPYGIVGLGVSFYDYNVSSATLAATNSVLAGVGVTASNIDVDMGTAFTAKFGGGFDWFINSNWIINFEGSYITSDTDGDVTITANGSTARVAFDDVDADRWMIGGGVKYLFS